MHPGAKSEALDELAQRILGRLAQGLACEFEVVRPDTPGSFGNRHMMVVPSFLFRENDTKTILVVVLGKGSFLWNGVQPLTPWQMIVQGLRPLEMAADVAYVLNRVQGLALEAAALRQASPPVLQIEMEKKDGHRSKHRQARRSRITEFSGP